MCKLSPITFEQGRDRPLPISNLNQLFDGSIDADRNVALLLDLPAWLARDVLLLVGSKEGN